MTAAEIRQSIVSLEHEIEVGQQGLQCIVSLEQQVERLEKLLAHKEDAIRALNAEIEYLEERLARRK